MNFTGIKGRQVSPNLVQTMRERPQPKTAIVVDIKQHHEAKLHNLLKSSQEWESQLAKIKNWLQILRTNHNKLGIVLSFNVARKVITKDIKIFHERLERVGEIVSLRQFTSDLAVELNKLATLSCSIAERLSRLAAGLKCRMTTPIHELRQDEHEQIVKKRILNASNMIEDLEPNDDPIELEVREIRVMGNLQQPEKNAIIKLTVHIIFKKALQFQLNKNELGIATQDKRILLAELLVELLNFKHLDKISVQDIPKLTHPEWFILPTYLNSGKIKALESLSGVILIVYSALESVYLEHQSKPTLAIQLNSTFISNLKNTLAPLIFAEIKRILGNQQEFERIVANSSLRNYFYSVMPDSVNNCHNYLPRLMPEMLNAESKKKLEPKISKETIKSMVTQVFNEELELPLNKRSINNIHSRFNDLVIYKTALGELKNGFLFPRNGFGRLLKAYGLELTEEVVDTL